LPCFFKIHYCNPIKISRNLKRKHYVVSHFTSLLFEITVYEYTFGANSNKNSRLIMWKKEEAKPIRNHNSMVHL
jgi:hypothetical protein